MYDIIQNRLSAIRTTIKNERIARGISQTQLAAELHINQKTYSKIESGDMPLRIDKLISISEVLHISVKEIVR